MFGAVCCSLVHFNVTFCRLVRFVLGNLLVVLFVAVSILARHLGVEICKKKQVEDRVLPTIRAKDGTGVQHECLP
jgi:hypothetical protein